MNKNYLGKLYAICELGETGSSLVALRSDNNSIYGLKLFPGGNFNFKIKIKEFDKLIKNNLLEEMDNIPSEILEVFTITYENNLKLVSEEKKQ